MPNFWTEVALLMQPFSTLRLQISVTAPPGAAAVLFNTAENKAISVYRRGLLFQNVNI